MNPFQSTVAFSCLAIWGLGCGPANQLSFRIVNRISGLLSGLIVSVHNLVPHGIVLAELALFQQSTGAVVLI